MTMPPSELIERLQAMTDEVLCPNCGNSGTWHLRMVGDHCCSDCGYHQ